jgi:hypothetical protein
MAFEDSCLIVWRPAIVAIKALLRILAELTVPEDCPECYLVRETINVAGRCR